MTTNLGPGGLETSDRPRQSVTVVAGGSMVQAVAAAGAAVLAIIGLTGTRTFLMMGIATIALGAAFLMREGGFVSQSLRAGGRMHGDAFREQVFATGVTGATIAGITGVALGILALVEVEPWILVPAAIIVFGGSLLVDSVAVGSVPHPQRIESARAIGASALPGAGGELLVGVSTTALGILALLGVAPVTLSLVALLALGVSTFLVGSAVGTKLMTAPH